MRRLVYLLPVVLMVGCVSPGFYAPDPDEIDTVRAERKYMKALADLDAEELQAESERLRKAIEVEQKAEQQALSRLVIARRVRAEAKPDEMAAAVAEVKAAETAFTDASRRKNRLAKMKDMLRKETSASSRALRRK